MDLTNIDPLDTERVSFASRVPLDLPISVKIWPLFEAFQKMGGKPKPMKVEGPADERLLVLDRSLSYLSTVEGAPDEIFFEREAKVLLKKRALLETSFLLALTTPSEPSNQSDIVCVICGKPIPDDDPDYYDHENMGHVHDSCLAEWEADEEGRAADFYFDMAGDR